MMSFVNFIKFFMLYYQILIIIRFSKVNLDITLCINSKYYVLLEYTYMQVYGLTYNL